MPLQFLSWNHNNNCRILQKEHYLLQLIVKKGDLAMNGYQPCWFLHTISYKQMCLAPVSYKIKIIAAWNVYLLFKFGQDCFVQVCIFLISHFRTYCTNMSHAIPDDEDDIKCFRQTEPEHLFDYTNWRPNICIWLLYFSSWSPKSNQTIFLILSPAWYKLQYVLISS